MLVIVYTLCYGIKMLVFPNQVSVGLVLASGAPVVRPSGRWFGLELVAQMPCDYFWRLLPQVFETEVLIDQGAYRGPKQHHF